MEFDRYGGGGVMIWGGISYAGKTDLITIRDNLNAVRYCNQVVVPAIVPYIQNGNVDVLQQDNARCHIARHTRNVLATHNINTLDWPAKSPDLSPVEHMWDYLGRKVNNRNDVASGHIMRLIIRSSRHRETCETSQVLLAGVPGAFSRDSPVFAKPIDSID